MACLRACSQIHDSLDEKADLAEPFGQDLGSMGKAAMAKARSHNHSSLNRQDTKAKVAPMGTLPRLRRIGLLK